MIKFIINKWKYGGLLCTLFFVSSALAYVPGRDRYRFNFGSDIPFQVGAQVQYHFSTHYYVKAGAGFVLETFMHSYQSLYRELRISTPGYELINRVLANSVILDARWGLSNSIYEGPYLEFGYNFMFLGRGQVEGHLLNRVLQLQNTGQSLSATDIFIVNVPNHGPAFYAGYRFSVVDQLFLDMSVGVYKPLFALPTLNLGGIPVQPRDVQTINNLILHQTWFVFGGLWLGLLF